MALNLTPEHVATKKQIGKLNENPVWEISTTGGLWVEVLGKGAGFEILGTGPHRAVARHIAQARFPSIAWGELSKSDYVPVEDFMFLLPKYEALTDRMRELQDDRG